MFCYILYFINLSTAVILRNYIAAKNFTYLYIISLAWLIYFYCRYIYGFMILGQHIYIQFDSLMLFNHLPDLQISLALTPLTFTFSFLVILIGCSTNFYILNYFRGEADESGFIFWINSFILSMLTLILSNNFFTLFLGWELIGLTSFFLINFWQSKRGTLKASFKAFSFNLVSDLFLLGALVLFYYLTNTSDISTFVYLIQWKGLYEHPFIYLSTIFLIICASIKSVQFGGHLWLPDSMEAPVPASALIHSATLVSAGLYLLLRFNILLVQYDFLFILLLLGSFTAAYGGVVAAAQTDMKKLLAYSTMSHCGFLLVLVSFNNFFVFLAYFFLHGIYKAATFFCAGSFIRFFGSQDTRVMGSGIQLMSTDAFFLLFCSTNLCGLPFSVGVLYKTFFFKLFLISNANVITSSLIFIGLLSSLIYFYRLVFYTLFDFLKIDTLSNIMHIENTVFNIKSWYKSIKYPHVIATTLLIIGSFYVYFYAWFGIYWTLPENHNYRHFTLITKITWDLITTVYNTYFIYFYNFYTIIIVLILTITWRKNSFFKEKVLSYYFFLIFFLIYALIALMA